MENISGLFQEQKQKQTKKKHLKELSFVAQFKIEFLLPFTSCKKMHGKMPANVCELKKLAFPLCSQTLLKVDEYAVHKFINPISTVIL